MNGSLIPSTLSSTPKLTPSNARVEPKSDIVFSIIHFNHLVFPCAIGPPAFTPPSRLPMVRRISLFPWRLGGKTNGAQLPPLAGPYAKRCHECRATDLQGPPEEVRRYRVRVERCNYEMDEMYRERKVQDQL